MSEEWKVLKSRVDPVQVIKVYGGGRFRLHSFLNLVLNNVQCSNSRPSRLNPKENFPNHWIGYWVAFMEICRFREWGILLSWLAFEPRIIQLVPKLKLYLKLENNFPNTNSTEINKLTPYWT
jgi:hypothetical protein